MYRNGINVRVCVNGRPVKEYGHKGLTFIESRHGTKYSIKVANDNGYRVMAIVSVDGLDVINGKPAEETNTGYIVEAYSSAEIKGYRISDTDSAAFVFSSKGESYVANAEVGDVRNAGVIGVRVIREKEHVAQPIGGIEWYDSNIKPAPTPIPQPMPVYPRPDPWQPYYQPHWTCDCNAVGNASANSGQPRVLRSHLSANAYNCSTNHSNAFDTKQLITDNFDTGTAWGEKQRDKVKRVTFDKGQQTAELVIYYSSANALEKMGVDLSDTPSVADPTDNLPKPFGKSNGYCTPPKNWNPHNNS